MAKNGSEVAAELLRVNILRRVWTAAAHENSFAVLLWTLCPQDLFYQSIFIDSFILMIERD